MTSARVQAGEVWRYTTELGVGLGAPREMGLGGAQGPMHWEHQVPHTAPRPMDGLGASHCSQALGSLAAPSVPSTTETEQGLPTRPRHPRGTRGKLWIETRTDAHTCVLLLKHTFC